jgi:osmotically-inducible protein OsmY
MTATRVTKALASSVLALGLLSSLQGCALLLLGGAAGGTLVAVDRRTLGAQTEDREIQIKTKGRIRDNLPNSAHVDVTVYNRRVLLTGEVPNDEMKERAETITRGVDNVHSIVNELAVMPATSFSQRSSDTYVTSKVQTALVGAKDVSSNYYKTVTERGNVYLMGLVTVDEGNRAADVVARVTGVRRVVKLFEYVRLDPAQGMVAASPAQAPNGAPTDAAQPAPAVSAEPTTGAVPDASVSAQPLDAQGAAPIANSAIMPGNPKATP